MKDKKLLSRFMRDTAHHNVIIEHDEGVYRHLIFKAPGTNSYRFDIITWPGYLTVTGDMGTWTFAREWDMVTHFFPIGTAEGINPGYWSEKVEAGTHGGREAICYQFNEKGFAIALNEYLNNWRSNLDEDGDADDIEKALSIRDSLLGEGFNNSDAAVYALCNADWPEMRRFPQPNYVLNKVAEESGEVIKAVIHYTEGREEWSNVEDEIIDNLAMLLRLVTEGDQVIGFTPPDPYRAALPANGSW